MMLQDNVADWQAEDDFRSRLLRVQCVLTELYVDLI